MIMIIMIISCHKGISDSTQLLSLLSVLSICLFSRTEMCKLSSQHTNKSTNEQTLSASLPQPQ